MARAPTDQKLQALMELERRGSLTPDMQSQLQVYRQQGLARPLAGTAGNLTEAQGKSTGFYKRALDSDTDFTKTNAATNPRGIVGDTLASILPDRIVNSNTSTDRQLAEQAKRNFVAASLRYESGAAINKDEFDKQERTFFPQPGDGPEVIAQKAAARKVVIEGLKDSAGPGGATQGVTPAPASAQPGAPLAATPPAAPPPRTPPAGPAAPLDPNGTGDIGFAGAGDGAALTQLKPEDRAAYLNLARSGASPEQITNFFKSRGFDVHNANEVVDARNKGAGVNTDVRVSPLAPIKSQDGATGAFVRGAADTITLGSLDELGGGIDLIGQLWSEGLRGQSLKDALYSHIDKNRAILAGDQEAHPVARVAGQLAGGFALPAGTARDIVSLAKTGAAYGGAYGFNSGEDDIGNRLLGGVGGGIVGAAGGAALGSLGNALARRAGAAPGRAAPGGQDAIDLAHAAQAEGVPVSRPMLDPASRDKMMFLESSPGSGGPVRRSMAATSDALEARAGALGSRGTAQDAGAMGQTVQDAGQRFIDRSRGVGKRLYDRAAQMAGDNPVHPTEAVAALDRNIADLSRNANANRPTIAYLNDIRADLVDADGNLVPKDIGALRDLRTSLRGQVNSRNLTATDAERRVGEVLDAARGDIQRDLGQAAPAAVRQYQRADQFWQGRQSEIKQVVQRVIGRRDDRLSGEQVMSRLKSMAGPNGDAQRLQRMVDKLSPDEQADYAATIASSLGRRSPEDDFSPALFVGATKALSPNARRTIFGQDGARSIANLRLLADSYRATAARLNNSRSGVAANWGSFLRQFTGGGTAGALLGAVSGGSAVATGGTGLVLGAASAGIGTAVRNLSARALMSPDLTRWLAAAPRQTTATAITKHIARLSNIAARDPAISQDVIGLQSALRAMNDNMAGRAAASSEEGHDHER